MDVGEVTPALILKSILPILKAYTGSSIGIIGCHSKKLSRPSCEYDLLLIGEESLPPKSMRVGEIFVDILFKTEDELRDGLDPESALSFSSVVPLRDDSWLLASASSSCKKNFNEDCKKASGMRLSSALKALGRVDENLAKETIKNADYWLMVAGYDFCYASLYANGIVPSPSHLLSQMKKTENTNFKEWTEAIGLPLASRAACDNRLEGLKIIYDILRTSESYPELTLMLGRYGSRELEKIAEKKARHLMNSLQATECFSYLGFEVVESLMHLLKFHSQRLGKEPDYPSIIGNLTVGNDRIIAEDVIKSLGLVRTKEVISAAKEALREGISQQAKRI
jgi:hypothetical protein